MLKTLIISLGVGAFSTLSVPDASPDASAERALSKQESRTLYRQLTRIKTSVKQTEIICSKKDFKSLDYDCFYKWDLNSGNPKLELLSREVLPVLEKQSRKSAEWGDSILFKLKCESEISCSIFEE